MESITQTTKVNEFSQEFKEEMENSICNYFEKCHLENSPKLKKSEIAREETLINNANQDIEYITPKTTPSLNGISDFMIHQIFSTDKIIPIYDSSDDEDNENTEVTENVNNKETLTDVDQKKMSTCNSDVTLNEENQELFEREDVSNETISKSFAVEFIEEEDQEKVEKSENPEVKIKEEFLEEKPKSNKRSKHISIFSTLERKASAKLLNRSKSTNSKSSKPKHSDDGSDTKLKKSKSKLGFSKILKSVKKRMSSQNLI
ncbi:hypothetical protein PIROE2DRAFT_64255 [Piromyces sp. E2]|nr:hypothetical protein PIROE2DRAFT_64255 [Piromyces sp. E2]|eukprot:OUM58673.1 hypothetical protein PIROE2DRAFT_64255 [Piromyces sp. E2]